MGQPYIVPNPPQPQKDEYIIDVRFVLFAVEESHVVHIMKDVLTYLETRYPNNIPMMGESNGN